MRHYTLTSLALIALFFMSWNLNAQEIGVATPYSDSFQGRKTASGEAYDKNKLTGAHKTLPFGTQIRVTRLDNKKSVTVRINDRGPYISGRVVEISRKAAERLDLLEVGQADVKIEVTRQGDDFDEAVASSEPPMTVVKSTKPKTESTKVNKSPTPPAYDTKETTRKSTKKADLKLTEKSPPKKAAAAAAASTKKAATKKAAPAPAPAQEVKEAQLVTAKEYTQRGLYQIELRKPKAEGYGVQVAAVTSYESMMSQVAVYQGKWFKKVMVGIEAGADGKDIYKIILGNFEDRTSANNYKKQLKKKKKINGFVIDLAEINQD